MGSSSLPPSRPMHIMNTMFPGSALPPAPMPTHARVQSPTLGLLPHQMGQVAGLQPQQVPGGGMQQPPSSRPGPVQNLLEAHRFVLSTQCVHFLAHVSERLLCPPWH